jgi:hypothetical protein
MLPSDKIFNSPMLQQQFEEVGYVIVDLISKHEIQNLEADFLNYASAENSKAFTTWAVNEYDFKKDIDSIIKKYFAPPSEKIFSRHVPFWGNFMIKNTDPKNILPLHADWSYVDESADISLNLWVPLTDTNEMNGGLCVVPGSHKVVNQIRGVNLYRFYAPNAGDIIHAYGKQLNVKCGQGVIYDHRLLHYSLVNYSGKDRRAATLIFVPKDRQLLHYFSEIEGGEIAEYYINSPEFFFLNNFYQKPCQEPVRKFKSDFFVDLKLQDFKKIFSPV